MYISLSINLNVSRRLHLATARLLYIGLPYRSTHTRVQPTKDNGGLVSGDRAAYFDFSLSLVIPISHYIASHHITLYGMVSYRIIPYYVQNTPDMKARKRERGERAGFY